MIFYELTQLYDNLVERGDISALEWKDDKVHYAIELNDEGEVINLLKLGDGKKPRIMKVPYHPSRGVKITPFFLYDTVEYLMNIDTKNKPEKARQRNDASIELHLNRLKDAKGAAASAVKKFFENVKDIDYSAHPLIEPYLKELSTAFVTFYYNGLPATNDPEIKSIVENAESDENAEIKFCLISGKNAPIARLHPFIKGVMGTQTSGATLVSFNAPSFESYGKEQGDNARTSVNSAKSYGAALNYLLSDRERTMGIGDLTVTGWVYNGAKEYSDMLNPFVQEGGITDPELERALKKISRGEASEWHGAEIDPEAPFYILGMAPNAGRISVNFFYKDTFGNWIKNLEAHQKRLEIDTPGFVKNPNLPIWLILSELRPKGQKSKRTPLSGALFKSIINNTRYPRELINTVLRRILAKPDEGVNWKKAAIIKAYLLKNSNKNNIEEVARVSLNTQTDSQPYLLGRLFSVLENIQEASSGGTNTTIKDHYLNSISTTPVLVFAKLLKLKEAHMKKLKRDNKAAAIYLDKLFGEIIEQITLPIPKQLNVEEQAVFMLGYYHQNQKRYEKKKKDDNEIIETVIEEEVL